jgi:hypothetical protein
MQSADAQPPIRGLRRWLLPAAALLMTLCACAACGYARYIDFPAGDDSVLVRAYLPEPHPLEGAHHDLLRGFMDSWELYRFETSPEGVAYLVQSLSLESQGLVYEFPLIISKPPAYWWDPEQLAEAEYFTSHERAADGYLYDLLYSEADGIVYMIRFDG